MTVFVADDGPGEWRDYATWPPAGRTREWVLCPGGALAAPDAAGGHDGPDRFRYDPADPTPSPGGPLLTTNAGRVDNTAVEARPDVLTYTTVPLATPVEVVGPVHATVRMASTSTYFDVFVRVCDVDPAGRSENICDGLTRVADDVPAGADGVRDIEVELWPTGYVWRPGHRIRVQVAGGAHPRYARNPGSGEPLATAVTLTPVDHRIYGGTLRMHKPLD